MLRTLRRWVTLAEADRRAFGEAWVLLAVAKFLVRVVNLDRCQSLLAALPPRRRREAGGRPGLGLYVDAVREVARPIVFSILIIGVVFVPLFAAMAMGSRGVARLYWWFIFLCGFALLIASGSRGSYVGILAGAIIGVKFISPFFDRRRIRRVGLQMAAVLIIITVSVAVTNLELVAERIEQSTSTEDLDRLSSGRTDIWRATILVQAENPESFLYGNGWNSHEQSGIWKSTHNTYLLRLYELGLIGLFMFIALLVAMVRQVRVLVQRTEGKERVLMSGIAFGWFGVIVAIFFVDLYTPWFYIWSFLGMSLRIAYEKDREYRLENPQPLPMAPRHTA